MKKIFVLAAAIGCAASTSAFAQDRAFGGPYVGAQLGIAQIRDKHSDLDDWYGGDLHVSAKKTRVAGGVRAGYDYVAGSLIAGALAEVSFGSLNTFRQFHPYSTSYDQYALGAKITALGSLRAKLGVTGGKLAGFVTGGVAFANTKLRYRESDGTGEYYNNHGKRVGYVVGIGAAYALSPHSSIGLDASLYQFGTRNSIILAPSGDPRTTSASDNGFYNWHQRQRVETVAVSYTYHF